MEVLTSASNDDQGSGNPSQLSTDGIRQLLQRGDQILKQSRELKEKIDSLCGPHPPELPPANASKAENGR